MRTALMILAAMIGSVGVANAQTTGQGYVLGGAGMYFTGSTFGPVGQLAGGGEAIFHDRFGVGGEGALTAGGGSPWTALSVDGRVHLPPTGDRKQFSPFLSGGFTHLSIYGDGGGLNGANIGGGTTLWFSGRTGLVMEARDVFFRQSGEGLGQYFSVRVGVAFR
jgi:hypothetical protein